MKFELNASMMCANYHNLEKEVRELEAAGIAKLATKPLDVHLMVEHPSDTIHLFTRCLRKGDTIYIHPEAEYHPALKFIGTVHAVLIKYRNMRRLV